MDRRNSGVLAQGDTVEEVRNLLIEVLEDYLIVSLQRGEKVPGFDLKKSKKVDKIVYVIVIEQDKVIMI